MEIYRSNIFDVFVFGFGFWASVGTCLQAIITKQLDICLASLALPWPNNLSSLTFKQCPPPHSTYPITMKIILKHSYFIRRFQFEYRHKEIRNPHFIFIDWTLFFECQPLSFVKLYQLCASLKITKYNRCFNNFCQDDEPLFFFYFAVCVAAAI